MGRSPALTSPSSASIQSSASSTTDPLALALLPPPDESPVERRDRLQREADAKRISDEIDARIREERGMMRRKRREVKVLLLGQSESGKSTTLKNFQLTYAPKAWQAERIAWRAVIQLNLLRSTNLILDVLAAEMALSAASPMATTASATGASSYPSPLSPTSSLAPALSTSTTATPVSPLPVPLPTVDEDLDAEDLPDDPSESFPPSQTATTAMSPTATTNLPPLPFTERHKLLRLRLTPLRRVQRDLERRLGAGAEEPTPLESGNGSSSATPFDNASVGAGPYFTPPTSPVRRMPQEFYVRSSTGWKSALERLRPTASSGAGDGRPSSSSSSTVSSRDDLPTALTPKPRKGLGLGLGGSRASANAQASREEKEVEETAQIIAGCREDIRSLWEDGIVRMMLGRRRVRLEERGGFFLNDVDRVAAKDYEPSDDDILRARLRTMGVQEYRFLFERGSESGQEWLMYDVGGTRTLRTAWAAYFDTMNAIIFLAPISCFDEKLAEDRRVNRLEDSFLLWRAVCSNKLLERTQLVLFLNKCDLLEKKLMGTGEGGKGIQFRRYVPSYGERENNAGAVAKYLKQKFRDMLKQYSPTPRPFYVHLTSVIDTKATAITLGAVREGILRDHLRGADFL